MSKQLSKLHTIKLVNSSKSIASNGEQLETIVEQGIYQGTIQDIEDAISVSVYGANINNMIRISTIRFELETYLKPKLNNTTDNLSKYYISIDNRLYKISSVKNKHIDIEMFEN